MFHTLLTTWFHFVENWGYLGIFFLMALESSIIPIPSEIVMPPAAYWASQGQMDFSLVIIFGALGSYFGSIVSYGVARLVGAPAIARCGKFFMIGGPEKTAPIELWVTRYGFIGIFVARLLPVIRHLISIPAGILKMDFLRFSIATICGAFLWCAVLSWFGREVIGDHPDLMSSPEAMVAICKEKLHWFVGAVIAFAAAYALVNYLKRRLTTSQQTL